MATQSTFLAYMFTKTSHMNHRLSKGLVYTRTHSSLPVLRITFTISTCSLQSFMCLGTHSILQHIIMYISTHLYIYLHASYSHIHVTKPRTCNNTTNMYQCCRYVTILRIHIYIDVTIIQYITLPPCLTSSDEFVYLNINIIQNSNETSIYIHNVI